MSHQEWSPGIGLRNAAISLAWRGGVTSAVWLLMLFGFRVALVGLGALIVPRLVLVGIGIVGGAIAGTVIGRGLEEVAGMTSIVLTLMAGSCAALCLIGGEVAFTHFAPFGTGQARYTIVASAMAMSLILIVKHTFLDP